MAVDIQRTTTAPTVGLLSALRQHWILATLPLIVLVGAALVLGFDRAPRYTATANLSVGRIYINNPAGVSGVIEATKTLASVYSRAIDATAVQQETAGRLRERSLPVSDQLLATPIPDSPLIKVSADSSSARRAVALANAASGALAGYVKRQGHSSEDTAILREYQQAERRYRKRLEERRQLARRYERDPAPENKAARDRASVFISSALLRREALRASYLNLVQGTASTPTVDVFSRATTATSDRLRMLQIMLFLGLIAGLAAGVALALLRTHHETRPRADA